LFLKSGGRPKAASLFQLHKNKEHSEAGFVFSNTEIEAFIRRLDRLEAAAA
jgi:hypothetical protein